MDKAAEFWAAFLKQLRLDDQSHPLPEAKRNTNLNFKMPLKGGIAWISTWIGAWGGNEAGVYLTFLRGPRGDAAYKYLESQREAIDADVGMPVDWESKNGKHSIWVSRKYRDVLSVDERPEIQRFLADGVNRFVNAFRNRLATFEAQTPTAA